MSRRHVKHKQNVTTYLMKARINMCVVRSFRLFIGSVRLTSKNSVPSHGAGYVFRNRKTGIVT